MTGAVACVCHRAAGLRRAVWMFVPSIGGISHHWTEDTKREDLAVGCRVVARAAERLLAG